MFKLQVSPFAPPVETIDSNLVIALHAPYSETSVSILINPQVSDFKENADQPGLKISNMIVLQGTPESRIFQFDLGKNKTRKIGCNCKIYELALMRIGEEKIDGQQFRFFEFYVKDIEPDAKLLREGTVHYRLYGPHADWPKNQNGYQFPTVNELGIQIESVKNEDKNLLIIIKGPLKRMFTFKNPVASFDTSDIFVVITWKDPEVNLYLNQNRIQTLNVRDGIKLEGL